MTDCEDYRPLLAGLMDNELEPAEMREINQHLTRCAACRADYEMLREETGKLESLSYVEVEDKAVADLWKLPHSRIAQNLAMVLAIGGYLVFLFFGMFEFFTADDEDFLPKMALGAILIGVTVLLGIAIGERVVSYRKDPYKEIER